MTSKEAFLRIPNIDLYLTNKYAKKVYEDLELLERIKKYIKEACDSPYVNRSYGWLEVDIDELYDNNEDFKEWLESESNNIKED